VCVQSMVSTIVKQRRRIQELENEERETKGKVEKGKLENNVQTGEDVSASADAVAQARNASAYIQGRLNGLNEYINEKELEKLDMEERSRRMRMIVESEKAANRAKCVAQVAQSVATQRVSGLGDVLRYYQVLQEIKKKHCEDIQKLKSKYEDEILTIQTKLKRKIEKEESKEEEEEKKKKKSKEEERQIKSDSNEEKKVKGKSSFISYALVALAGGVIAVLIQKIITKM